MKHFLGYFFIAITFFSSMGFTSACPSQIQKIPDSIQKQMKGKTWHQGCPSLHELRYLRFNYFGFDKKTHCGKLIIHKELARETITLFKSLYHHRFPIEKMELMDVFDGDDEASMVANNTSSYNCRRVTGHAQFFSQHSFGRAIDFNPRINPYRGKKSILPANGAAFVNRHTPYPGKITKDSFIYKLFTQYGWDWGGDWYDVQDYQHFEKRSHGEKRNPYGYEND